jgi:hypothetical protein
MRDEKFSAPTSKVPDGARATMAPAPTVDHGPRGSFAAARRSNVRDRRA